MAVVTMNETSEILVLAKVLNPTPTADSLDIIWKAASIAADGVQFKHTGHDILLVHNTDGANPYTFTLKGEPDDLLRDVDVGPYSLAADEMAAIAIGSKGFKDSTGYILVVVENVAVEIAVIRTPNLHGA